MNNYSYPKCDSCNTYMTEDKGCHSYWLTDTQLMTICSACNEILNA